MSLDAKYIFVDIEFLKAISECMQSLKSINEVDIEDRALIIATTDMIEEQIDELVGDF